MVFFNYAAMQMVAKIVYYGPGLCGKTTNLRLIYDRTTPTSRGEIVSLETETDRTLFFDLLPIDVGVIGGFKTKFQLYTVPGQVFYNVTRKLVLKGVDGIVFVADSQAPMLDANLESFQNLKDNLKELGIPERQTPIVLQYNKRDLDNISSVHEMDRVLNPKGSYVSVECSALTGDGVFETLKEISRQTLLKLKAKVVDQEERKKRENIVSFHLQKNDASSPDPRNLDEIVDETIDSFDSPINVIDDTIPEENSLPAFKMGDTDYSLPPQIGESSLPSVNLSDVDMDGKEIELDASDEFMLEDGSWSESEDELKLDFEFSESSTSEEDSFDTIDESDLDSLEMEIPMLDETIRDPLAPPFPQSLEEDEPPPPPPSVLKTPDKDKPEPLHVPAQKKKPTPPQKKPPNPQLDDLANLTKITGRRTSKLKTNQDILGDFLSSVQGKGKKFDKIQITTPVAFTSAQLNCIFVDSKNNVIHTQLIKASPKAMPNGKKEIRILLEIEEESE